MQDFLKKKTTEAFSNLPSTKTSATPTTTPSTIKPDITISTFTDFLIQSTLTSITELPTWSTTSSPTSTQTTTTAITTIPELTILVPTQTTTTSKSTTEQQDNRTEQNTTERTEQDNRAKEKQVVVIFAVISAVFILILVAIVIVIIRSYRTYPFKLSWSYFHRKRHPNYIRPHFILLRTKSGSYGISNEGKLKKWKRASVHSLKSNRSLSSLKIDPGFLNEDFIQMVDYPSSSEKHIASVQEVGEIVPMENLPSIIDSDYNKRQPRHALLKNPVLDSSN